jgi:hypothetical protein
MDDQQFQDPAKSGPQLDDSTVEFIPTESTEDTTPNQPSEDTKASLSDDLTSPDLSTESSKPDLSTGSLQPDLADDAAGSDLSLEPPQPEPSQPDSSAEPLQLDGSDQLSQPDLSLEPSPPDLPTTTPDQPTDQSPPVTPIEGMQPTKFAEQIHQSAEQTDSTEDLQSEKSPSDLDSPDGTTSTNVTMHTTMAPSVYPDTTTSHPGTENTQPEVMAMKSSSTGLKSIGVKVAILLIGLVAGVLLGRTVFKAKPSAEEATEALFSEVFDGQPLELDGQES